MGAAGPKSRGGIVPRSSLRARLTLWVVAIFTLIQWTTGAVFWLYQRAAIQSMYEEMLLEKAIRLEEPVGDYLPDVSAHNLDVRVQGELRWVWFGRYVVDVFDETRRSQVGEREPPFDPDALPLARALSSGRPAFATLDLGVLPDPDPAASSSPTIVYPFVRGGEKYALVIAVSDAFARRQLALLTRVLLLAGFIGPVAASVAGWFIAGVAVAPLERVTGFARRLGPESIDEELSVEESSTWEVANLSRELEEARQRIQAAFKAQERFLSNVSHEIKSPISVLLLEAQALRRDGLDEDVSDYLDSAQEEMTRLGRLVESFLTLTRVRDGKGLSRELEYPANDLVMDSVENCLGMAQQYRVRLSPHLLDGELDIDTTICGEPDLLRTMLDNLVRNAIRFSPKGESVRITLERDADSVRVRVGDRGPGIPPDKLDAIFDRFAQTEDEQRRGRGHGLGLEIAQGIAELHAGRIVAANREGGGAEFVVTLPVKDDSTPGQDGCDDEPDPDE